MRSRLVISAFGTVAFVIFSSQVPTAYAQHGHGGHGHGHGGHGHGHISGHSHGSVHGHLSGHGGHVGHDIGHGHGHVDIHLGHHFIVPHIIGHHHHGSYWVDSGLYYYQPRTYASSPGAYVTTKPVAIEFGGYAHLDDLAGRFSLLANDLCLDMHYNYSHNPGFAEAYREAYQILDMAKYLEAVENQGDRAEIARCVTELDPLFHHVQGEVQGWSRSHQRQIGESGIMTKLEIMEALLHHLMYDVGVEPHSAIAREEAPAPATSEVAPPPPPVASPPPSSP